MKNSRHVKTAVLAILVLAAVFLLYGRHMNSRAEQDRLRHDARTIEHMLAEQHSGTH